MIKYRRMKYPGPSARMREDRGAYRVLVGKPEGKWTLRSPVIR